MQVLAAEQYTETDRQVSEPKATVADLGSLRQRYSAILEENVMLPLLRDLKAHRAQLETRAEADGVRAELEETNRAIATISEGVFRMDDVEVDHMARVFGA